MIELQPILKHTSISEQEFIDGQPVVFRLGCCMITALYRDDKIILESSTYESSTLRRIRQQNILLDNPQPETENNPIIIEKFDTIQDILNYIETDSITTKPIYNEDEDNSDEVIEYINKKYYAWDLWDKLHDRTNTKYKIL